VHAVMNIQIPQYAEKFLTSWENVSFSRRALLNGERKYHTERETRNLGCISQARTYSDNLCMQVS